MKLNITSIFNSNPNFTLLKMQPFENNLDFPILSVLALCSKDFKNDLGLHTEEHFKDLENNIFSNDDNIQTLFDSGFFNGSDYQNAEYVFGETDMIQSCLYVYLKTLLSQPDSLSFIKQNEMPVFIFHAEHNGKGIIFSNSDESEMSTSLIKLKKEEFPELNHLGGGHYYDDQDIVTTAHTLLSMLPEAKNIKFTNQAEQEFFDECKEFWEDSDADMQNCFEQFLDLDFMKKDPSLLMLSTIFNIFFVNNTFIEKEDTVSQMSLINHISKYNNIKNIEQIPDFVHMTYIYGSSNKEYNLELQNNVINISYGPIGKKITKSTKTFTNNEEARKEYKKAVVKQIKKGYDIA